MLDNNKVKEELINYIGERNLKMLANFYKEHKLLFPFLSQDGIIINTKQIYGESIKKYINDKLNIYPNIIGNEIQYDDYIYEMILDILDSRQLI